MDEQDWPMQWNHPMRCAHHTWKKELNKDEDGAKQNLPNHCRKQCSPNNLTTGKDPLRKSCEDNVDEVSGKELTKDPARPQDKPHSMLMFPGTPLERAPWSCPLRCSMTKQHKVAHGWRLRSTGPGQHEQQTDPGTCWWSWQRQGTQGTEGVTGGWGVTPQKTAR